MSHHFEELPDGSFRYDDPWTNPGEGEILSAEEANALLGELRGYIANPPNYQHDYRKQSECLCGAGHVWVCVAKGCPQDTCVESWDQPQGREVLSWWTWRKTADRKAVADSLDQSYPPSGI